MSSKRRPSSLSSMLVLSRWKSSTLARLPLMLSSAVMSTTSKSSYPFQQKGMIKSDDKNIIGTKRATYRYRLTTTEVLENYCYKKKQNSDFIWIHWTGKQLIESNPSSLLPTAPINHKPNESIPEQRPPSSFNHSLLMMFNNKMNTGLVMNWRSITNYKFKNVGFFLAFNKHSDLFNRQPSVSIVTSSIQTYNKENSDNNMNILGNDDNVGDQIKRCWRCDKLVDSTNGLPTTTSMDQVERNIGVQQQSLLETIISICPHCSSIQPISKDVNYFRLFNLDQRQQQEHCYDIDLDQLRHQYLRLQQYMHPDMNINRSNTEAGYSLDNASIINNAYKTLRDPYQRALYMLRIMFNITIDEANVDSEPELLLEIMELNEDVELATDKESILALTAQVEENITNIVKRLNEAFSNQNATEARKLTIQYSYYNSVLSKLKSQSANIV